MHALLLWLGLAASCPDSALRQSIQRLAAGVDGRIGVAILTGQGQSPILVRGAERFPMQSVYKLPIAMAVLHQVDLGRLTLNQPVVVAIRDLVPAAVHSPIRDAHPAGLTLPLSELLEAAIVTSDGTASDVLLRLVTPEGVNAYLRWLDVRGMVVATTEQEMAQNDSIQYRNWATPAAAADLLVRFDAGRGLMPASQQLLRGWLTETATGPHRLKGLLPAGTPVAHKTGTSGSDRGLTRATNDIGIISLPGGQHLVVAVFVTDSHATEAEREGVIARIGQAAWQCATAEGP